MKVPVKSVEATPNPNAVKFTLARELFPEGRSYHEPVAPGNDALADKLFEIDGVKGLLLLHDFVTVTRQPEAAWPGLKAAVKKVLNAHEHE
jgi:hypothetical protein